MDFALRDLKDAGLRCVRAGEARELLDFDLHSGEARLNIFGMNLLFIRKAVYFLLVVSMLTVFTFMSTACNTVRGVGRDVGTLGSGIERAAR